jgi:hypothetical protein
MTDRNLEDRKQGTEAQQQFRNAANANVIRQAGEGLESASSTQPVPGNRLTAAELKAETGRRPGQEDSIHRDAGRQPDPQAKREEREALRRQGEKETDSDLDQPNRPEAGTALVDPVITSNPD